MSNDQQKPEKLVMASKEEKEKNEKATLDLERREKEFERKKNKFEVRFRHHNEWKEIHETVNYWIDKAILFALYFLIIIAAFYGAINIGITVFKGTMHSIYVLLQQPGENYESNKKKQLQDDKPTSETNENKSSKVNESQENINKSEISNNKPVNEKIEDKRDRAEMIILETVEHVFLYLLPLFIMLGFFHYYKNNASYSLVDKSTGTIDEESSTKSVNLTKLLFISSIISYVIIKVVEEIFIKGIKDLTQIISFGILLLMLMIYYLFLDRKNH